MPDIIPNEQAAGAGDPQATQRPDMRGERSGPQVVGIFRTGNRKQKLERSLTSNYQTYRTMRKDPTLALARALSIAPILASEWTVHAEDDAPQEAQDLIGDVFLPMRGHIMQTALYGGIDFGWQGYEKIFAPTDQYGTRKITLSKLKPLLQDYAVPLVNGETGTFVGYELKQQPDPLSVEYAFHVAFRVEGTDWRGQSLMENALGVYNQWVDCNDGAVRYDQKVAGAHFVVYYPVGSTEIEGEVRDNYDIAVDILDSLESSGSIVVPNEYTDIVDRLNDTQSDLAKRAWSIEVLEDKVGRQPTFIDRLRYLDVQKVRALLMPERVGLEGEFGTKAEAGEHKDLWLTLLELNDRHVTDMVNWHCVDQLLDLNWGPAMRGMVWLEAAPLTDVNRVFLQDLYKGIMANGLLGPIEFEQIDTIPIRDALGVASMSEGGPDAAAEAGAPMPGKTPEQIEAARHRFGKMFAALCGRREDN